MKLSETLEKCPKCGAKAKQFEVPEYLRQFKDIVGRYYCSKCGWLEGFTMPMESLIEEKKK